MMTTGPANIVIGVDGGAKAGDTTTVVIASKDLDGTMTILDSIVGEMSEQFNARINEVIASFTLHSAADVAKLAAMIQSEQEDKPMTGKTLDQVRSWLTGQTVEGLPHRDLPTPSTAEDDEEDDELVGELTGKSKGKTDRHGNRPGLPADAGKKRGRYTATKDGRDAKLHFGRFADKLLSEIEDQTYLQWLLKEDFPESLKAIVRLHVTAKKRR